jgi:hypothetical protein
MGLEEKAYIIYPNGKADVASSFLFFWTIKGYSRFINYCSGKLKDYWGVCQYSWGFASWQVLLGDR